MIPGEKDFSETLASALTLDRFLRCLIEQGAKSLGNARGWAFLFDHASGRLELFVCPTGVRHPLSFAPGQGLVGTTFHAKRIIQGIIPDTEKWLTDERLAGSGFVSLPIGTSDDPLGVLFLAFDQASQTETAVQELTHILSGNLVVEPLRRLLVHERLQDLLIAAEGPSRIRQAVSRFLTDFQKNLPRYLQRQPDIVYVQLADLRRGTIRTVQGYGLPLSYQTTLSHSLIERNIQPIILRSREVHLIAGFVPAEFNEQIFQSYHHERYSCLFMPLFAPPRESTEAGSIDAQIQIVNGLLTEPTWEKTSDFVRGVTRWRRAPPEGLVFGTLEVGYLRDPGPLDIAPWTVPDAFLCVGLALSLATPLYEATLMGTIDLFGRSLARIVQSPQVSLMVAMPDGSKSERRSYPMDPSWSAAPLEWISELPPPDKITQVVVDEAKDGTRMRATNSDLDRLLENRAEDVVRLALRLDDYGSELSALSGIEEDPRDVGTLWPPPVLEQLCGQTCRETGAADAVAFLFETASDGSRDKKPQSIESSEQRNKFLLGGPVKGIETLHLLDSDGVGTIAKRVADTGIPEYRDYPTSGVTDSVMLAVLPLDFAAQTSCVLALAFRVRLLGFGDDFRRDLESRIQRWTQNLSRCWLLNGTRFANLMASVRARIAKAHAEALRSTNSTLRGVFAEHLLPSIVSLMQAKGAVLTVLVRSERTPSVIERFWYLADSQSNTVSNYQVLAEELQGPCRQSVDTESVFTFELPTHDTLLLKSLLALDTMCHELSQKNEHTAGALERLAKLMRASDATHTLVVCPVLGRSSEMEGSDACRGTLSVVLPGYHVFGKLQCRQILEVGELLNASLESIHRVQMARHGTEHHVQFGKRQDTLVEAKSEDDLVGALLARLGEPPTGTPDQRIPEYWGLAKTAAVWYLARGSGELVLRSARKEAFNVLRDCQVVQHKDHPFFAQDERFDHLPKRELPSLRPFHIKAFPLTGSDLGSIGKAYGQCGAWLLSVPLVDATSRVWGVLDLVRDKPFAPGEHEVLEDVLPQLTRHFCAALDRCLWEHAKRVAMSLSAKAGQHLTALHAQKVYGLVVDELRRTFHCRDCDLFYELDDRILLYATTRPNGPLTEKDRWNLWVEPVCDVEPLGAALASKRKNIVRSGTPAPTGAHMSGTLQRLMANDSNDDRLLLPFFHEGTSDRLLGLIQLVGPIDTVQTAGLNREETRPVHKSGRFTDEDMRRIEDVVIATRRVLGMARLAERQAWVVREFAHFLGQHQQILRGEVTRLLDYLGTVDHPGFDIRDSKQAIDQAFNLYQAEVTRLSRHAQMSTEQPDPKTATGLVDISRLVRNCCTMMRAMAEARGVIIDDHNVTDIKPLAGYEDWLQQAVLNLLDNAIKYSFIRSPVNIELWEDASGTIRLTVSNQGVGIPAEDTERIFEPFYRSRVPDSHGIRAGSGIGLAIVKEAFERWHQGTVCVKSQQQRGTQPGERTKANVPHKTTFTATLNRAAPSESAPHPRRSYGQV